MARTSAARDTSIRTYRSKRNFDVTAEPAPLPGRRAGPAPIFVVQKHAAHRAGLHWDFRLEHDGVLWSWAVPKGPSLDPADRRMAVHVEDHPLDYADFQGRIPDGNYGAGDVETWDRGTWSALGDADEGMRKGDLQFTLEGQRLNGRFHLVRLERKPGKRQDAWFLIKGHDEAERAGGDVAALEANVALRALAKDTAKAVQPKRDGAPTPGAKRGALPKTQAPQLASLAEKPPAGDEWLSEIKLDGYRLLIWLRNGKVTLRTRRGLDWTDRLPAVARAVARLPVATALLDGELVALKGDGSSSFPDLQAALSAGRDRDLFFFMFDLLHVDGWDLRPCALSDRKAVLEGLTDWSGLLRYSGHIAGQAEQVRRNACEMKLEGIIAKRATASYRPGRGGDWLKVKCLGREEFIVLGWTLPAGTRTGFGALHLGYYDPKGTLQYAGGVGTGYSERELTALRTRLDALAVDAPPELLAAGDPLERSIRWVRPKLIAEVQYMAWSGAGRVRHAVFLGLREDKTAKEVVRDRSDPEAERWAVTQKSAPDGRASRGPMKFAIPPRQPFGNLPVADVKVPKMTGGRIVVAKAPKRNAVALDGVEITHPDRPLWPGITKQDLAEYWEAVAAHALPGLAKRPLAIVRCPEGIGGEHFFQKNGHGYLPHQIREGRAGGQPFLVIDDVSGLVALAQMSAIELHPWGATEEDPTHPDRVVFDLDPGEGVAFGTVVKAAQEVRARLEQLGLACFCRTTGGKGLHVVVPLTPRASWDEVKPWCRAFAELMSQEAPEKYLPTVSKADRKGRILIDWLRNGLGATAVSSFCPRARPEAGVATPLRWEEVTAKLNPGTFTVGTVPDRVKRLKKGAWEGFDAVKQVLPELEKTKTPAKVAAKKSSAAAGTSRIVHATAPKRKG
jgi:bifunctional non-homologous end joining protein LigD